ncbi:MAG: asparaginase [Chlamydiae bacterium]|nr:asparaginase [Chlamydiota bacterium]
MKKFLFLFIILFFSKQAFCDENINPDLPTVAIVTTGGTIAEVIDPKTGAVVPAEGGEFFKGIPLLYKVANIKHVPFSNIDSSQMTPEMWANLSKAVDEVLKDSKVVGAVVAHGTDTMAEGSYFLDLTLKSKKPVVVTGAMRSASDPYPDGPFNLLNSVYQVLSKNALDWGVTINMNQYILSSRDAEKTHTTNPQTFSSGEKGYLGYVFNGEVFRFNDRLYKQRFPVPEKMANVDIFFDYAGAGPEALKFMVDNGADGIVIESLGAGNVNSAVYEGIQYALKKNVIIVLTSSVPYGGVFPIYGDVGGGASLAKEGVIFSRHLRGPKARLLLMVAMANVGKDRNKLEAIFANP